jgi:hypothetical protein
MQGARHDQNLKPIAGLSNNFKVALRIQDTGYPFPK